MRLSVKIKSILELKKILSIPPLYLGIIRIKLNQICIKFFVICWSFMQVFSPFCLRRWTSYSYNIMGLKIYSIHKCKTDQKGIEAPFSFQYVRENSQAWFAWNLYTIKKQTPQYHSNPLNALCVSMPVYIHNMHSSNNANNTLHLFKAGSKEYKQWFIRKLSQCFPIPFSCLFVWSQLPAVSK